jgi:8-oxo-dGTP diphosphatase
VIFCSTCGSRLPAPAPVTCPSCGADHYRNAKPCAGALVMRDGKLLLMRRAHEPWLGRWDIPGGFCELDEHPARTAAREAREETGFDVEITGFLGLWLDRYPDPAGTDEQGVTLNAYYHAVPVAGPAAGEADPAEAAEIGWFEPAGVPGPIAFPDHAVAVLEAWKNAVKEGRTVTPLPDVPPVSSTKRSGGGVPPAGAADEVDDGGGPEDRGHQTGI